MTGPDAIRSRALEALHTRGQLHLDTLAAAIDCPAADVLPVLNRHDSFRRVAGARGWEFDLTSDYRISMDRAKSREAKKAPKCIPPKATSPAAPPSGSASGEASSPVPRATNTSPRSKPARAPSPKPVVAAAQPEPLPSVSAPTLSIETIDPDRARRMLARSTGNRSIRRSHVAWLADQMARGLFRLTHQAVAFSVSGRLLDGHHRLSAIAQAGKPAVVAITYGWPDESWDAIDCGIVRAAKDRLILHDNPHRNSRAIAMIISHLRCERGLRIKAQNEDIVSAWYEMRNGIDLVDRVFPANIARLTRLQLLAAIARYHQLACDRAPAFAETLRTGAGPPDHPAVALRAKMLGAFYLTERETYWYSVAAMREHRADRPIVGELRQVDSWDAA